MRTATTTARKTKTSTAVCTVASFPISKIIRKNWEDWSEERRRIFYWTLTNPSPYDDHDDWDDKPYWQNSYLRSVLPWGEKTSLRYETWVAYFDGGPIGWAVVEWRKPEQGMLHVFVKEEYRRHGIGSALIERVTRDCPKQRLRMYHWDQGSRAFYLQNKRKHPDRDMVVIKEHV